MNGNERLENGRIVGSVITDGSNASIAQRLRNLAWIILALGNMGAYSDRIEKIDGPDSGRFCRIMLRPGPRLRIGADEHKKQEDQKNDAFHIHDNVIKTAFEEIGIKQARGKGNLMINEFNEKMPPCRQTMRVGATPPSRCCLVWRCDHGKKTTKMTRQT